MIAIEKHDAVVRAARAMLGVPYLHQGRSRRGVDCIGLVLCAYEAAGVRMTQHDQRGYSDRPHGGLLEAALSRAFEPVVVRNPGQEIGREAHGRVGLFRFAREPQHVGILTAQGTVIHSYSTIGRVVEHALCERWQRRLVAIYEMRQEGV